MAAECRARCNKLTPAQRESYMEKGWTMIHVGPDLGKKKLAPKWLWPYSTWTPEMLSQLNDVTLLSFSCFARKIGDGTIWEKEMDRRKM